MREAFHIAYSSAYVIRSRYISAGIIIRQLAGRPRIFVSILCRGERILTVFSSFMTGPSALLSFYIRVH